MVTDIRTAAVLGSGVMGSGIAALLANSGISVLLLDRVPSRLTETEKEQGFTLQDSKVRNRLSENALKNLLKQKPAPLTIRQNLSFIDAGNLEDDRHKLREADWIIEAVVENLEIKKQIFTLVDQYRKQGSIVSSNTSGISITAMSEGRSEDFCRHFLGTHFFNPPRYLKLLEMIPGEKTAPHVLEFMKHFAEEVLGKGVVVAKDTPNFIANRIGTYGLLVTIREMEKGHYSVGEVDSVTGPLIGRPKSATFRTLDVVGIDTFLHVADTVHQVLVGAEKADFSPPPFMQEMMKRGWLGNKSGQGFYEKKGKEILELNPVTMQYQPRRKLKSAAIEESGLANDWSQKLRMLLYSNDRAGSLLWNVLTPVCLYSAEKLDEIAPHIAAVDQAMKWGFGWERGPFEMWDALGLKQSVEILKTSGKSIPRWVTDMLEQGFSTFYKEEAGDIYYYHNGEYRRLEENQKILNVKKIKQQNGIIKKNSGASLVDIGDGVVLLEFHSPHNAIGPDILQMIHAAVDEVEKNYKGLVIGNEGKNFCVGANLGMILMEAQDDNLFELDFIVQQFQQAMMKIKYSARPVVAAPFGMALGGGAEVCLPAAHIQASSETYIGLVETGVGLIPGGGGNKELYIKTLRSMPKGIEFDLQKVANKVFETIAMAKVSGSAAEAAQHHFLNASDGISANGSYLLHDAKQVVLTLSERGYKPPQRAKIPVTGETGYATLLLAAQSLLSSGNISEHDLKIAKKLAYVIAGGKVPFGTLVDEQYLLDLEREAFLSLVTETKTMQRMQHMLIKGKPLRN
ncbi:3-hydroxyacyl-CoA dehydrogenase/enoyl-CoA hydratase family protein [Bacillus benzoevorans]|uniref:3-hydroxyacyl-CoA dehydrogenase n=1 Tax=Bacillus benzoevorans TaxID=1456 RepID=A0A7X0HQF6_9BACI|nr:3-hydroxyacyl-CoA dehydrogenase/enoyl-CoA hydratase family protein [Bacillus benzoevorans]MBB6445043.1 3-hydroxyacyl-CoA dehydrogenase [Bacillus benzoevorans]